MKFCRKCNIEKELKFFDIKNNQCKACVAKYQEEYRKNNKQKASQYGKEYKENNKERLSQSNKEYYIINKDKISEYVEKNKDKISQRNKEYYVNNKEKILNQHKTISKNRRKIDAAYRLRHDISGSIWYALKRNASSKAGESYLKYLPYTIQELKKHLESQFEPWMTWENRGHYKINGTIMISQLGVGKLII